MPIDAHHKIPNPTLFVIFGVTGDLTGRKLIPALYNLAMKNRLPEKFILLGLNRHEQDDETLQKNLYNELQRFTPKDTFNPAIWEDFSRRIHHFKIDFLEAASYTRLAQKIEAIETEWQTQADCIFYMATPPELFGKIAELLGQAGLGKNREHSRLVVEKPIGQDLESAHELNRILLNYFDESQIFRIDHYLGKETVQNILAFRFANPLFEPVWDRRYVDHLTITVAEEIGVENRADYYDQAGALRDMVQNHLMQLLCLVAMEAPVSFEADEIRSKKSAVLQAIRPIAKDEVYLYAARGQYDGGWVKGQYLPAYRGEPGIPANSNTETFVALKLFIDNWRWQDVPFYLRTGKRLPDKISEISIRFRPVPHQVFPSHVTLGRHPARLVICIQPDEGIVLKFQAKQPGPEMRIKPVDMRFCYSEMFHQPLPEAYETLLWDLMLGDPTLFMRADQVEAAWRILTPILDFWSANPPDDFPNYATGTWGPEVAEGLISVDGRYWLLPSNLSKEAHWGLTHQTADSSETTPENPVIAANVRSSAEAHPSQKTEHQASNKHEVLHP
jgi:glucose-6-phosphate 1-dehydrogenase